MVYLAAKSIVNVVAYCSAHYEKGLKLNFRHIQQTLIIMIQLVDPGLVEKLTQMSLDAARSTMESFGLSEDQMEEALEKAEEDAANSFTPVRQLINILTGSILVLIVAAIMSIFLKKEADPNKIDLNDISGKDA